MLHSWSKDHFGSKRDQIMKKKELLWKAEEVLAKVVIIIWWFN